MIIEESRSQIVEVIGDVLGDVIGEVIVSEQSRETPVQVVWRMPAKGTNKQLTSALGFHNSRD